VIGFNGKQADDKLELGDTAIRLGMQRGWREDEDKAVWRE
jgi:hypothetical protein